jgi:hypothetical protein
VTTTAPPDKFCVSQVSCKFEGDACGFLATDDWTLESGESISVKSLHLFLTPVYIHQHTLARINFFSVFIFQIMLLKHKSSSHLGNLNILL